MVSKAARKSSSSFLQGKPNDLNSSPAWQARDKAVVSSREAAEATSRARQAEAKAYALEAEAYAKANEEQLRQETAKWELAVVPAENNSRTVAKVAKELEKLKDNRQGEVEQKAVADALEAAKASVERTERIAKTIKQLETVTASADDAEYEIKAGNIAYFQERAKDSARIAKSGADSLRLLAETHPELRGAADKAEIEAQRAKAAEESWSNWPISNPK